MKITFALYVADPKGNYAGVIRLTHPAGKAKYRKTRAAIASSDLRRFSGFVGMSGMQQISFIGTSAGSAPCCV